MNRRWRKGQKEKFLATMKAKKEVELKRNAAVKSLESAANSLQEAEDIKAQMPQVAVEDVYKNYEFHYRRGLVTAMECILRELR